MKLILGYKDHRLLKERWYQIVRGIFISVNVIGGVPLYMTTITELFNGPKPWLFLFTVIPIIILFQMGGMLVVRYIFLYTVLGTNK